MEIDRYQRAVEIHKCYTKQYKEHYEKLDSFMFGIALSLLLSEILKEEGLDPETGFSKNGN